MFANIFYCNVESCNQGRVQKKGVCGGLKCSNLFGVFTGQRGLSWLLSPIGPWFSASSARFAKMTWDSDCQIVSFEKGSILLAVKFNHISALGVHP